MSAPERALGAAEAANRFEKVAEKWKWPDNVGDEVKIVESKMK